MGELEFFTFAAKVMLVLNYKNLFRESYKCRICTAHFASPEELRIHRMVNHKGHMLTIKR